MSIARRIARPLLSSMFVAGGLDAVRHPEGKVKAADPVARPLAAHIPGLPEDTETLVRINGAVQVAAGGLLAVGRFRRIAALALIGSVIPTTYAGHRFWEESDDATRRQQRTHFLKNLGLLGGLILAAVDTDGAPSVSWRLKRRGRDAALAVATGRTAGKQARRAARSRTRRTLTEEKGRAGDVGGRAARRAAHALQAGTQAVQAGTQAVQTGTLVGQARTQGSQAKDMALQARGQAVQAGTQAVHRAQRVADLLPPIDVAKVLQKVAS